MKMKKFGAIAASFAMVGALALAGCGNSGSSAGSASKAGSAASDDSGSYELVKDGTLTVATSPDFPPFENLDNDEYVGFDMDLARAVAKEMGLEVEFKNIQFDGILPAIAAGGQADVGWSGITVDPDRAKQVDFSDTYYMDDQSIVTMKDNADVTADNVADSLNKDTVVLAVQSGTSGETYAKENFPNAKVQPYGNATDCFAAMQSGQATAVVTNLAVGKKMVADAYQDAQVVKEVSTGEEYAVAVSKDNPELTKAVNKALKKLEDDGTIDELVQKNFS